MAGEVRQAKATFLISLQAQLDQHVKEMAKAADATEKFGDTSELAREKTLRMVGAFREVKDAIGNVDTSLNSIKTAMEHFNVIGKETSERFRDVSETASFCEAILMPVTNIAMVGAITKSYQLAYALGAVSAGISSIGFALAAMRSTNEADQQLFIKLTGVTLGLAGAQVGLAIAQTLADPLEKNVWKKIATAAVVATAFGVAFGGVGAAIAGAYAGTMPAPSTQKAAAAPASTAIHQSYQTTTNQTTNMMTPARQTEVFANIY